MPLEERFITFSLEEISKAVRMRAVQEAIDIPAEGHLVSIEIDPERTGMEHAIALHFQQDEHGSMRRLNFDQKFFAFALVFYCQGCGIPLPARGTKTLNIQHDRIIMKIEMESAAQ